MKNLVAAAAVLASTSGAFAAIDVKASAYRIDMNLRLYEICGTVTGATNNKGVAVDIKVDAGKNEGHYVTMTNDDGKFCQLVRIVGTQLSITASEPTTGSVANQSLEAK